MPRKRSPENRGFPPRWSFRKKAYYYQVPPGQEHQWDGKKLFRLGGTVHEAYSVWIKRLAQHFDGSMTINRLLDRYAHEVIPTKALATQITNQKEMIPLRRVMGDNRIDAIKPQHVYKYFDVRSRKHTDDSGKITGGKNAARREVALLSHAYSKAVEWGIIDKHPFKGEIRLEGSAPRTRYVEDWEVVECLSLTSKRTHGSILAIQAYIRIKLLTGLRGTDLIKLTESQIKEDGIHIVTQKRGRPIIYVWTDQLRTAVESARTARPVDISPYLFCNKDGECYADEKTGKSSGWSSMWQRFMTRVLNETDVKERFTEHDLRAKCASDADSLEHARALLAHADSRLTDRIYRRKAEKVLALRKEFQ